MASPPAKEFLRCGPTKVSVLFNLKKRLHLISIQCDKGKRKIKCVGYPYEFSVPICDSISYRVAQKSHDKFYVLLHIERQVTGATRRVCGIKSVC